ncbi:XRE family transcriptional regulator [Oscillibacter valericigenes]|uniref:helix-turn-helix domain-containing protein n=1 Tax=Oscillibacter ruminantium TaxID=1263547 RepID=UPI00058C151E|nr:XRE family transcriptional regulator [Oscillibacter ruminantium]MDN0033883.1 XRE family transcriptional regulator [Oscillibacter valericigenes]
MDNISKSIGEMLKRVRKERKLSLDAASKLTGVSKAMLGQIERGESAPTVLTLWRISSGLKITLSSLISEPDENNEVVNIADIKPVLEEESHMMLYNVFPFDPISGFDYYKIVIEPHTKHESIPHLNVGMEYIVVTQGTLEMTVNGVSHLVRAGQAFSFNGNSTHCYANPSDEELIFHNIMKYK